VIAGMSTKGVWEGVVEVEVPVEYSGIDQPRRGVGVLDQKTHHSGNAPGVAEQSDVLLGPPVAWFARADSVVCLKIA
jgi:hypothetical protein